MASTLTPTREFLDGETRGRRIQRHGETYRLGKTTGKKDAISDRPRGKSSSRPRTGQVPGLDQGAAGGQARRKKKPPDTTVSVESSSASWEKLDQGKNHRGSVVKRASATGAWSLDDPMMDGSRWRKDYWPRAGSTGGLEHEWWSCSLPFRVGSRWALVGTRSLLLPAILRRRTRQLLIGASPVHLKSRKPHLFSGGSRTSGQLFARVPEN